MKRTPLKRKSTKKVSKKTKEKWADILEANQWYTVIPDGSHGSNPIEKKLWRLVTDYVRIRDFEKYGNCISCGKVFTTWDEAQGGHYRPFTKCKGYTKFDYRNVFAQCAYCNSRMNEDKFEGGRIFAHNIVNRFNKKHLDLINEFTTPKYDSKREYPTLLNMMSDLIHLIYNHSIKPPYWHKLKSYPQLNID